jgi:hypothetical protein
VGRLARFASLVLDAVVVLAISRSYRNGAAQDAHLNFLDFCRVAHGPTPRGSAGRNALDSERYRNSDRSVK